MGWTIWPSTVAASLVFVLAIWAMRPRLGVFKSFQLYLVASNAATVLTIPVVIAGLSIGAGALSVASVVSMVLFFVYGAFVLHRRAADSALGLGLRTAGLAVTMLPAAIAMWTLSIATLELAFRREIGVSVVGLIADASRAAATQSSVPP